MPTMTYNRYFRRNMTVVGECNHFGEHAYIVKDGIQAFADFLNARISDNRMNIVIVDGIVGSGKSTAAIELCKAMDCHWKLERDYIYSLADLKRKLDDPKGCSKVSLIDEGSVVLNSGNAMRKEDRNIVVLFDTMRSRGWTIVICVPHLSHLNRAVREDQVDYLIHMPEKAPIPGYDARGFAQIFEHKRMYWSKKPHPDWWKLMCITTFQPLEKNLGYQYEKVKKERQDILLQRMFKEEGE